MGIIGFFFASVLVSATTIKIVAGLTQAGKSDLLSSVIAAVLALVVQTAVGGFIQSPILSALVSVAVVAFVLESVLNTNFAKAGIIALAAVAGYWLVTMAFANAGIDTRIVSLIEQIS